jgi:hypothetical protein
LRHRFAYLVSGLRLDEPVEVGDMTLTPVPTTVGYRGRELREVLNGLLAEVGYVTDLRRPIWAAQVAPRNRLVFVVGTPRATDDIAGAVLGSRAAVGRVLDLLTLIHGGAPRLVAGVNETSSEDGEWRTLAVSAGSGAWPGSTLEKLSQDAAAPKALDVDAAFVHAASNARTALWLSLYRDLAEEPRWDVRILRCWSLLESIGREVIAVDRPVLDEAGVPRLDGNGRPLTPRKSQLARVWLLVGDAIGAVSSSDVALRAHPSRSLWEEVGVWYDVRNAVAHEGLWQPPTRAAPGSARRQRVARAFEVAARGDALDSGWLRYADAAFAAVEAVLRAAVQERLSS